MVPRFFMNIRYRSRLFKDEEGDELEPEKVHEHALTVAKSLIQNANLSAIRDWFDCSFEITDQAGAIVTVVPFSAAVEVPNV